MITGKDIKKLREEHNLTQLQLARAISVEESTLANYEGGRRNLKIDTLESIANVFGYTVDFNLIKKENTSKNSDFYKEKSYDEIANMSIEDLTDYVFITQSEEVIARICKVNIAIASSLELTTLKDLIEKTISNTTRDVIYFKLNNLHTGLEEEISILIEEVNEYLELETEMPRDVIEKVHYIDVDLYGDVGRDEMLSDESKLLDKDKNNLGIDHEIIFNSEYNPLIYNAQSMDLIFYIKDNPVLQLKY